jgi:hypothetical protein
LYLKNNLIKYFQGVVWFPYCQLSHLGKFGLLMANISQQIAARSFSAAFATRFFLIPAFAGKGGNPLWTLNSRRRAAL